MTSMTFHLHLANHANKKGLFPVMLRMTQNRKSKRLRTLVEVRTAEWNKNKECVRASSPNSEWMNEVLEKELRKKKKSGRCLLAAAISYVNQILCRNRGFPRGPPQNPRFAF